MAVTENLIFPRNVMGEERYKLSGIKMDHSPPRILLTSSADAWYELTAHTSESSLSVSEISMTVLDSRRLAGGRRSSDAAPSPPVSVTPLSITALVEEGSSFSLPGELIFSFRFYIIRENNKSEPKRCDA